MTLRTFIPTMMILAALSITIVGCSGGDSGGPVGSQTVGDIGPYFPLGAGYLWSYMAYSPSGTPQGTYDVEIIGMQAFVSGAMVYFIEMPPLSDYVGWAADEDGLWYYSGPDLDEQYLDLIVANPATLGSTISLESGVSFTITSLNTAVTTYLGTRSCVQVTVEEIGSTAVEIFYLAEGIGIVRYETWEDALLQGYDELTAHDLGG